MKEATGIKVRNFPIMAAKPARLSHLAPAEQSATGVRHAGGLGL